MKRNQILLCLFVFCCSLFFTVNAQTTPSEEETEEPSKKEKPKGPRNSFKVEPFSPLYAYLMFSYERATSSRMGYELNFGVAGLGLDHYPMARLSNKNASKPVVWGMILKGGPKIKFFNKRAKSALQGFYLKPNLTLAYYTVNANNSLSTNPRLSVAIMANIGYQHVFFKRLVVGAYGGVGLGDHIRLTDGQQVSGGIETGFVDLERGWNIDIVLNLGIQLGVAF